MKLNKAGFDRFVKLKAHNLVSGIVDAMEGELSHRGDLGIKISVKTTASTVTGTMRVRSDRTNILAEELGTELQPPQETVGRLIKDPSTRAKLVRKAAKSL